MSCADLMPRPSTKAVVGLDGCVLRVFSCRCRICKRSGPAGTPEARGMEPPSKTFEWLLLMS
eukprot:4140337-Alexandrium_andersonii.AAC.1